jgi:arylsulfatase A-like enzyme
LSSGDAKQTIAWNEDNWCGLARFGATSSGSCIPETMPRLGGEMRGLGYETIGVTANPLLFGAAGFSKGFDQWFEVPESSERAKLKLLKQSWQESSAARAAPEVTAAVATALAQRSSDRFFLYVHYMDVHDWAARGVPYRETVEAADRAVGELLLLLERQGLLDGAAIVLTSDHGESLDEQHLLPTTPRHVGNPSFEPVLEIPLIVVGTTLSRDETLIRSEDLFGLLLRIAGGAPPTASDLLPDELFITEQIYQTYRRGRWKSYSGRLDGTFRLVDLAADPDERFDVAEHHPQVVAAHRERVARLTASLAAPDAPLHEIDEAQRDRLRTLGYIE